MQKTIQETIRIKLHTFQDQAIFNDARFIAIIAGLQSGKTIAGSIWSRMQFDENEKEDGLIAAPTYKILQQSTLPKFFEINQDFKKYYRKGDSVIEIPNRGKIYIRSTENPNVLEGMTLRWAWLDEGGQMKLDAWINVQGRLSILQGKCFISTTPYSFNWLATDFYEQFRINNPSYKVVQFRSIDNPYFPQEEYDRVKGTMNKRTFERRYMGLFTKMEGLVYDDFNYNQHAIDSLPKFDYTFAGIDWGYTNPSVILVVGLKDGIFYIADEFYKTGKTTAELKEQAKNMSEKWQIKRIYADSAEPDRIAEFNNPPRLYTLSAFKDIEFGLNKVRQLIKEERLKISKKCIHTLEEIETYHYPENKEEKEDEEVPMKIDDHCMDAMRYALATFQPITATKTERNIIIKRHEKNKLAYSMKMV